MRRRHFNRIASALAAIGALPLAARAEDWPERPIRLVVPFSAGSIVDRLARAVAEPMSRALGQPVLVDNQPGAGGNIAVDRVARTAPDGLTLVLAGDAALTTNVGSPERAGFEPLRDLAPVSLLAITPNVLAVTNALPVRSVIELAELARLAPVRDRPLSYASSGVGTSQHRAGLAFARFARADLTHVPYNQAASMLSDLVAGRVDLLFGNAASMLPMARDGRIRLLAVTSRTRLPDAPDLPTMIEAGADDFEAVAWFGLLAPAGTPTSRIARLERAVMTAVASDAVREPFAGGGVIWVGSTAVAYRARIRSELESARRSGGG